MRDVEIYDLEAIDDEQLKFRVSCSSGTYVRSLCHDIAKITGNLGCMSSLIRTKVGRFSLEDCVTLKDVEEGNFTLHSLSEVLSHFEMVEAADPADIFNGKQIHVNCDAEQIAVTHKGEVLAIYEYVENDIYRCVRGLW